MRLVHATPGGRRAIATLWFLRLIPGMERPGSLHLAAGRGKLIEAKRRTSGAIHERAYDTIYDYESTMRRR